MPRLKFPPVMGRGLRGLARDEGHHSQGLSPPDSCVEDTGTVVGACVCAYENMCVSVWTHVSCRCLPFVPPFLPIHGSLGTQCLLSQPPQG